MNSVFNPSTVLSASKAIPSPASEKIPRAVQEASEHQLKTIRELYATTPTARLAQELNMTQGKITRIGQHFGIKKDRAYLYNSRVTNVNTDVNHNGFRRDRIILNTGIKK